MAVGDVTAGPGIGRSAGSYAATAVAGGIVGTMVAVGARIASHGRNGPSLVRALAIGAGAFAGLATAANLVTSGRLGSKLLDSTWGQRNQIGWALQNIMNPMVIGDARTAYLQTRTMQTDHWGTAPRIDDGVDAVRHAFAAAMLAARLVEDRGIEPAKARAIVRDIGDAHELDGADNFENSAAMDRFNNDVGAGIGVQLAASGRAATPDIVLDQVLIAARAGRLQVIDAGVTRASHPSDVTEAG